MNPTVQIQLKVVWIEEDSDGETCFQCGDVCFLKTHFLAIKVCYSLEKPALHKQGIALCPSCRDLL